MLRFFFASALTLTEAKRIPHGSPRYIDAFFLKTEKSEAGKTKGVIFRG
jgi:hypothetical protein